MVTIALMLATRSASAQPLTGAQTAAGVPSMVAGAGRVAPVLDGVVLGDPAWADAVPATGFRQTQPDEGEPASERTEVRVVFTESTLYVGVICYDRDPGAITVSGSRRDSSLDDSDSIQIILDTFQDKQSGFVFGTSPAGQEYEALLTSKWVGVISEAANGHAGGWSVCA